VPFVLIRTPQPSATPGITVDSMAPYLNGGGQPKIVEMPPPSSLAPRGVVVTDGVVFHAAHITVVAASGAVLVYAIGSVTVVT
jgi:hypothetical protein